MSNGLQMLGLIFIMTGSILLGPWITVQHERFQKIKYPFAVVCVLLGTGLLIASNLPAYTRIID
ncbi:MAG: hypothetical protein ACRCWQ_10185 [Bacilli bacterium]